MPVALKTGLTSQIDANDDDDDDDPEWMREFAKQQSLKDLSRRLIEFEAALAKASQQEEKLKHSRPTKKQASHSIYSSSVCSDTELETFHININTRPRCAR